MGRIAKLLSFVRFSRNNANVNDVKVDPGGGPNVTAEHFSAAGDDAHPLAGDYVALNTDSGSGRESAVGYIDAKNEPKAKPGDKRIYARNEDGALIVEVWLKNSGEAVIINEKGAVILLQDGGTIITTPQATFSANADGSIEARNGNGSFGLLAGGEFIVNGVTIDTSGNISTSGTLNADDITADNANVTLSTHTTPAFGVPPTQGT